MITFKCDQCGGEVHAPEERVGAEYECPGCGKILVVPERHAVSPKRSDDAASPQPRPVKLVGVVVAALVVCTTAVWLAISAARWRRACEHFDRAKECYERDEYDRAIEELSKAIKIRPDFPGAYSNRGHGHACKNDLDAAIADYTKAVEFKPDDAKAYHSRGVAYARKGDFDRAIADFTKAIELKPNDALAYCSRAFAYGAKREYDRAIADFTKTIELRPDDALAYCSRGSTYGMKGDLDRARKDYEKALALDPDSKAGQRARSQLKLLGIE